ncbi:MAG: Asp-tRNA(Asn)/Glu-tRNA(Gln) amidotransferase subunit GatA [Actinomycetia bacterium]|nr:Asp-tRNA(Asn)/Glu-tRNA(Gln) amidotransferase subunit GatA [Actinomycetes bacterium]
MGQLTLSEYRQLSVADIRDGIAARQFLAADVVEAALTAVEALDCQVHSFLEVTGEAARQAAAHIDQALAAETAAQPAGLGTLAGVPIAFKDNMNLEGSHTTCASRILENYHSLYTATCVARSLEAGGLSLGKLNMDEFAFGSSTETSAFGCTFNPWDLERVPGGSSGGPAAAVAAGIVTVSLGSDTGGSIRQPASFCGVVGFKPTYGLVSRYGVVAFGSSLDQVGPLGRSVADVAAVMDAIGGRDPLDCTSQHLDVKFVAKELLEAGVQGMRIGYVPDFLELDGLTGEVKRACEAAMANLEALGAQLVPVELPNAKAALAAYYVIGPCEAFSNLSRFDSVRYGYCAEAAANLGQQYEQSRAQGFGPEVIRRVMLGSYLLSAGVYDTYYYPAQQVRTLITADYARAFECCEALITPTSPRTAFRFGEIADPTSMYLSDIFTLPINIAGNGGLSLPVGMGDETGLPVGVQIIGPQFKDDQIFRVAAALEAVYAGQGSVSLAPLESILAKTGGDVQ